MRVIFNNKTKTLRLLHYYIIICKCVCKLIIYYFINILNINNCISLFLQYCCNIITVLLQQCFIFRLQQYCCNIRLQLQDCNIAATLLPHYCSNVLFLYCSSIVAILDCNCQIAILLQYCGKVLCRMGMFLLFYFSSIFAFLIQIPIFLSFLILLLF